MIRQIYCIAAKQWKYHFRSMDFWVLLLTMGVFFTSYFLPAGNAVRRSAEKVGIFSMLPIGMTEWMIFVVITIGLLFMVSDIPIYTPDSEYKVLRTDRKIWYLAQWLYLAFMVLTYTFFIWLMEMAYYLPNWKITTEWGDAVKSRTALLTEFGTISMPQEFTESSSLAIFGMAFFLFVLLGMLLGAISLVCNLYFSNSAVGIVICALLIFCYMLERHGDISLGLFSPLGTYANFWQQDSLSFLACIGYYTALCILLFFIGRSAVNRADLKGEARKA